MRCVPSVCPVLVILIASVAGAQPAGPGAAGEELLKRDKEWAQAAATRDLEQIVSYWTDDAVVFMPGDPPVAGKEAIRKYVGDYATVWRKEKDGKWRCVVDTWNPGPSATPPASK